MHQSGAVSFLEAGTERGQQLQGLLGGQPALLTQSVRERYARHGLAQQVGPSTRVHAGLEQAREEASAQGIGLMSLLLAKSPRPGIRRDAWIDRLEQKVRALRVAHVVALGDIAAAEQSGDEESSAEDRLLAPSRGHLE